MELRHLRYFVSLAEYLSFTRAAERVHVTQSTLSHQIRQLEDEVGQPLFERIGKKVVTTEAGELFLGFAERALKEVDHGIAMLKQQPRGGLTGVVRIGATHTFNIGLIPECVALFLARHPTVRVRVDELAADQIGAKLLSGELDLGISYRPQGASELWFEALYNE
jgi:LysR family cyn operon transcriptional activator